MSSLEVEKLKEIEEFFKQDKYEVIPQTFKQKEREVLRFLQACEFNVQKCADMLVTHFEWRARTLPCKLTENVIRLLVRLIV